MDTEKLQLLEEKIDLLFRRYSELKKENLRLSQTLAQKDLEIRELKKETDAVKSGKEEALSRLDILLKKLEGIS